MVAVSETHGCTSLSISSRVATAQIPAIRHDLEARGQGIGPLDTLIAAQARRLGATVVTRNLREFQRVPGLLVENWEG
jgi:predicted nucleic acid-binding protein